MIGVLTLGVVIGALLTYEAVARWQIFKDSRREMSDRQFWLTRVAREGSEE